MTVINLIKRLLTARKASKRNKDYREQEKEKEQERKMSPWHQLNFLSFYASINTKVFNGQRHRATQRKEESRRKGVGGMMWPLLGLDS